jgi:nitrite reductase/ring-hydroxylating ferredoxin subunit
VCRAGRWGVRLARAERAHRHRPLVGHAGGEAIFLARRGNDIFAVGATCTHYSGPLGEGLLVKRCPWHHVCFDLRTGAPLRASALNPIACYEVKVEDGR